MQPLFENPQDKAKRQLAQALATEFIRNYRRQKEENVVQSRKDDAAIRDMKREDRANAIKKQKEEYEANRVKRENEDLGRINAGSRNVGTGVADTAELLDDEVVEYTYKPGDTFGQVILDLGLNTNAGLWGGNGDVEYYARQLDQQGIWPHNTRSNIPVGTTIRLRKRPMSN